MSRRPSRKLRRLPPLLVRVIKSAESAEEDAGGCDISGVAEALREFGAVALWVVPAHGVFVPNEHHVALAIERLASAHFKGDRARRQLDRALRVVEDFDDRDAIESACNRVRTVDGEASFYAGLAFGITIAYLPKGA